MPLILQGKCSHCDYESPMISDGQCGGIIVSEPSTIESCDVDSNDHRVAILAHPLEEQLLTKYGFTDFSVTMQGRYLIYRSHFCSSCGQVYKTRHLTAAIIPRGCVLVFILAFVAGIVIGYFTTSILIGWLGFGIAAIGLGLGLQEILGVYVRIKFRDRAREFEIKRICLHCGSRRAATRGTFPCPSCQERTMKVEVVGIS